MRLINKGARPAAGGVVLLAHFVLGWIILHQARLSDHSSRPIAPLTLIAIAPTAVPPISTAITVDLVQVAANDVEQPVLDIVDARQNLQTIDRSRGNTIPPRPSDPSVDLKPYALKAGLPPGVGITVVLRVEVLGDGFVGRIQVDVSGGSVLIDDAAIAYVRSLHWIGGRIDDQPAAIWIRWGVRLDG